MSLRRALAAFLLGLPLFLAGCSLFPTTRTLPVPKAPSIVYTVTPARLVEQLNQRWDALETLTVKVTIQATTQKPREGLETTMPTVNAQILLRKPEMLRVYGRAPVINIPLFDMASDGENFTVFIPSKKEALKGANSLKKKSPNALENLRPDFFFYAMVVRGIKPDDRYTVTQETDTVEDPQRKHLYSVPQYILRISRPKSGSQQDTPVRFIYFHRDDLLPYQQDVYDSDGNLETQVFYAGYRDFGGVEYPSTITIKRPLEASQLILSVQTVNQNQTLKDDQFQVTIPSGTEIKNLD